MHVVKYIILYLTDNHRVRIQKIKIYFLLVKYFIDTNTSSSLHVRE